MFSKKIWIALCAICITYWMTWHGYNDNPNSGTKANPLIRHSLNYILLLLVAISGIWGWKSYHPKWPVRLWITVYTFFIATFSLFGIIDLLWHIDGMSLRNLLANLRLFFTSPIPYGILMYLVRKSYSKANTNKKDY